LRRHDRVTILRNPPAAALPAERRLSGGGGGNLARIVTLEEAAALVPDGALVTFGGFDLNRAPMALARALVRRGARRLRLVGPPNPLVMDLLVGAGAAGAIEFAFLGFQYEEGFVVVPNVRRAIERGLIAWRERDAFEIMTALRAAAQGVPFLPGPDLGGSQHAARPARPVVPWWDSVSGARPVPVVPAIRPDVALIHAQAADHRGNLFIADPYGDDLLVRASALVVATAERLVEHLPEITIPRLRVAAVAEAPGGAYPTSCYGEYPWSVAHLRLWVELAAAGQFGEYIDRFVTGPGAPDMARVAAARPIGPPVAGGEMPVGQTPAAREGGPGVAAAADRLVVAMARLINDGETVLTGVASALPVLAVALARATHAPGATHITAVGAVNPRLGGVAMPCSSVDPGLLLRCEGRVVLTDILDLSRQGRVDTMFFGAAQIDAGARLNLTRIGAADRPEVKLPGPAGSAAMRSLVRKVIVMAPRHAPRTFVKRVDFVTSAPAPANRETWVVSGAGLFRLEGGRLRLVARQPGTTLDDLRARTGFAFEGDLDAVAPAPTPAEAAALARLDPTGLRHRLLAS
jgi:acyl CoA:acetate/3-ketoacid CoA transferase alpha subunit/acyl CoA:acetate/3-ketoacid CoA transferase beta subunit